MLYESGGRKRWLQECGILLFETGQPLSDEEIALLEARRFSSKEPA